MLSTKQIIRYEKHIDLPQFGEDKQYSLSQKSVAIIGAGGLGCPVALYLIASGIGTLSLYDEDTVSLTNLQRQILYQENTVGLKKVDVAKCSLEKLNAECSIQAKSFKISSDTVSMMEDANIIVDATDNFETRYFLNQYCYDHNIPLITGAVLHYSGQVMTFKNCKKNKNACYNCLYPVRPMAHEVPTCVDSAVLSPVVGVIGTIMASEVIKELTGLGSGLGGKILIYDALSCDFSLIALHKDKNCSVCGVKRRRA